MNLACEQGHDWKQSQVKDISYCDREHCPAIRDDQNPLKEINDLNDRLWAELLQLAQVRSSQ